MGWDQKLFSSNGMGQFSKISRPIPSHPIPWNHILVKYRFKKQILRTTVVSSKPLRCSIAWCYISGGSSSAANSDQRSPIFWFRFQLRLRETLSSRLRCSSLATDRRPPAPWNFLKFSIDRKKKKLDRSALKPAF